MERTEEERQIPWTMMMGVLGGRLVAISGFLIFLSFVLAQDGIAFYAFIAFAYIITIPYSLWMRNQDRMRRLAPLQFLVDLVFVSGLVYFAGSHGHDFLILLYPLIILSAGIILPLKQTIQITILSIISYTLVILLMSQNILVEYPTNGISDALVATSGAMILRILIFIFFGIASAYVSRRCDYISKKEKQFREITQVVFENVKTGLLLLDSEDKIIMANDRACVLLGRDAPGLIGKSFSTIHRKPSEIKDSDSELRGGSDYFRRSDGSVFPVSIEDADLTLPSEAVPNAKAKPNTLVDARILNFNDLSHFLRLQSQTRQLERIRAAANMAKEMAHQIRTPLTGISGAVQLLQLNLKNPMSHEAILKERTDLYLQIIQETTRMDKVIQNFLDYAEFSPSDIRELIHSDFDREFSDIGQSK
ncbi:MAG: PAS domain-containing protein [Kiritimatiellales bacterium]|nr:PAS domain-containing protein [Kiritimatiellales bacterium]